MDEINRFQDLHDYVDAWSEKMIEIWAEKIERRNIVFSGQLHESLSQRVCHAATGSTITLKFLEYGLAQEYGVGNGYTRGNGGNLEILDPAYRKAHGLNKPRRAGSKSAPYKSSGKPRKAKPWFNAKYYTSVRVLVEDLAHIVGDVASSTVSDALSSSVTSASL